MGGKKEKESQRTKGNTKVRGINKEDRERSFYTVMSMFFYD